MLFRLNWFAVSTKNHNKWTRKIIRQITDTYLHNIRSYILATFASFEINNHRGGSGQKTKGFTDRYSNLADFIWKTYILCYMLFLPKIAVIALACINLTQHGSYKWVIMHEKCGRPDSNEFQLKWRFGTHGNWKKSKSWGPFWSYQLNSTANSAHLAQFLR